MGKGKDIEAIQESRMAPCRRIKKAQGRRDNKTGNLFRQRALIRGNTVGSLWGMPQ